MVGSTTTHPLLPPHRPRRLPTVTVPALVPAPALRRRPPTVTVRVVPPPQ